MILRRSRDDSGLTLVELIVAMSLTTIVLAAVGTVFVGALRSLGTVNANADLTGNSEIAMETITGRLRATDYGSPGKSVNPSAVLEASYNAMTVTADIYDSTLANSLATSIAAVDPTSTLITYLQTTGMVSKKVRFVYAASTAACGNRPGVTQTITPPRYVPSTKTFVWDTGPITSCVLRTTTAPSLTAPLYSLFTYYAGCGSTAPATSTLSLIQGVGIDLKTSDSSNNLVELKNQICLVNVTVASPTP